ncbi:MAG: hypothetical protein MUE72_10755, partial [Chitinophagaceae bacterium]|nr:hypothetical protein [Chitinophagaceae bacterium]
MYYSIEHWKFPKSTQLKLYLDLAPFSSYFDDFFSFPPSVRPRARPLPDDKYRSRHCVPSSGQK